MCLYINNSIFIPGFSAVFTSLEESGKVLYKSITKATVDTVNHK